jgi:DNA-binding IclR family transcriptional regulator
MRKEAKSRKQRLRKTAEHASLSPKATGIPEIAALLDRLGQLRRADAAGAVRELQEAGRHVACPARGDARRTPGVAGGPVVGAAEHVGVRSRGA